MRRESRRACICVRLMAVRDTPSRTRVRAYSSFPNLRATFIPIQSNSLQISFFVLRPFSRTTPARFFFSFSIAHCVTAQRARILKHLKRHDGTSLLNIRSGRDIVSRLLTDVPRASRKYVSTQRYTRDMEARQIGRSRSRRSVSNLPGSAALETRSAYARRDTIKSDLRIVYSGRSRTYRISQIWYHGLAAS